jgi:predicted 3-demethylubiquinone-9 3-methyltransferase (glyoxalase superfamily)
MSLNKITTCLWFDGQAEEAANYYVSVFANAPSANPNTTSAITSTTHYTSGGATTHRHAPGSVMTVSFTLQSHPFVALNGGPEFKFNEAVSFQVHCEDQAEIDYFWDKLGEGGDEKKRVCGWVADKWGVSWQVVPRKYLGWVEKGAKEGAEEKDKEGVARTMEKMMGMKKLDEGELREAFEGK